MENLFLFIQQEILLVTALVVLILLFVRRESKQAGAKISVSETVQAMNSGDAVLVDVREKKDYEAGHVSNAINIPYAKAATSLNLFEKHKDKRIILTDKMGQHAGTVGRLLGKNGYNVCRMSGGMEEWKVQNLPVVK